MLWSGLHLTQSPPSSFIHCHYSVSAEPEPASSILTDDYGCPIPHANKGENKNRASLPQEAGGTGSSSLSSGLTSTPLMGEGDSSSTKGPSLFAFDSLRWEVRKQEVLLLPHITHQLTHHPLLNPFLTDLWIHF